MAGFLYDYFNSHRDVSHGLFSTGDIRIDLEPAPATPPEEAVENGLACATYFRMTSRVWLAPFDFGIMQKVAVAFCRSVEDTGYLEIRILLERLSGEANAWRRINKAFLHELRKTLLVWRSLDAASKEHYEKLIATEGEKRGIDVGRLPEAMSPQPSLDIRPDATSPIP